jgi:serine protease AprX
VTRRTRIAVHTGTLLAALLVVLTAPALARATAFVPPGLLFGAAAEPNAIVHVVVVGKPGVTTAQLKEVLPGSNDAAQAMVRREFKVINALALDVKARHLFSLVIRPEIASITPDPAVNKDELPLAPWRESSGFDAVAPAPDGAARPAIAIVDSGVANVAGLGAPLEQVNVSSFDKADSTSDAGDQYGHGTIVAGIAAQASPGSPLVSLRVTDDHGRAVLSDVLAAADWIWQNHVAKGIGVANFSIRSTFPNYGRLDPLNLAVEQLWLNGVVVVASAGNNGAERMLYAPASDPFVITVGAVDTVGTADIVDDGNAPWTSYGATGDGFQKPELGAPGRYMVGPLAPGSTLVQQFGDRLLGNGTMWMSGTSFAAPVVSGAAARLLAQHPGWTPDQVKGALMVSAQAVLNAAQYSVGVGEIDVAAANEVTDPPNPNENLYDFVEARADGGRYFDGDAWNAHVASDAAWTSAAWTSAAWTSAAWTSAAWTSAAWTSAAWTSAAWTSAAWTSAAWTSAAWTSAAWTSAAWTSAAWTSSTPLE